MKLVLGKSNPLLGNVSNFAMNRDSVCKNKGPKSNEGQEMKVFSLRQASTDETFKILM